MAFQQSQGHSAGSDHRVSAHPHIMFEVSWFSMGFIGRDTVLSHQDLSPGSTPALPVCLNLRAWRSPCFKTTRHIICNSQVPSTKVTLGRFTLSKTNHPSEGSDPMRQASATAFQQGESPEMTMSWLEGRKLSVPQ